MPICIHHQRRQKHVDPTLKRRFDSFYFFKFKGLFMGLLLKYILCFKNTLAYSLDYPLQVSVLSPANESILFHISADYTQCFCPKRRSQYTISGWLHEKGGCGMLRRRTCVEATKMRHCRDYGACVESLCNGENDTRTSDGVTSNVDSYDTLMFGLIFSRVLIIGIWEMHNIQKNCVII
ncbi:hypothetical protein CFP56_040648 [Quercus suber]|uniref:Uncharacterized protein n=1 Tax=Quercus suber TaxID=58331 RepID=A0AAW0IXK3_QUESU